MISVVRLVSVIACVLVGATGGCTRPASGVASSVAIDAGPATPPSITLPASPAPDASRRAIASLRYGNTSDTGGVDLLVSSEGAASGSFMNRGFSKGGAEIIPISKTLTAAQVADLFAVAHEVADAIPSASESSQSGWHGTTTLVVHFTDGADLVFAWPGDGAPADPRVMRLATLLRRVP